jgi:hypothetical protein
MDRKIKGMLLNNKEQIVSASIMIVFLGTLR